MIGAGLARFHSARRGSPPGSLGAGIGFHDGWRNVPLPWSGRHQRASHGCRIFNAIEAALKRRFEYHSCLPQRSRFGNK